jgi:ketosteroid isomerase-like protein
MVNGMRKWMVFSLLAVVACASSLFAQKAEDQELMHTREAVWRAWFNNDVKALHDLVPADAIEISASSKQFRKQADIFRASAEFHAHRGKLVRLEFPHTEVQHLGEVAVLYSSYVFEIDEGGKKTVTQGRAMEVFVHRNGRWVNPGWHTDEAK